MIRTLVTLGTQPSHNNRLLRVVQVHSRDSKQSVSATARITGSLFQHPQETPLKKNIRIFQFGPIFTTDNNDLNQSSNRKTAVRWNPMGQSCTSKSARLINVIIRVWQHGKVPYSDTPASVKMTVCFYLSPLLVFDVAPHSGPGVDWPAVWSWSAYSKQSTSFR